MAWFGGAGFLALICYLLWIGQAILQPLFIAVFIVMILNGLVEYIERLSIKGYRLPRVLAFLFAIALAFGGIILMSEIFLANVAKLNANLGTYQANLRKIIEFAAEQAGLDTLPSLKDFVGQFSLRNLFTQIFNGFKDIAGSLFSITLFSAFVLLEQASLKKKLHYLAKDSNEEQALVRFIAHVSKMLKNYIGAKTIISLITALISYGALWLIGVDFPGFWALLIFILNFIPYIGSLIAVLFPVGLSIVQFAEFTPVLWTAVSLLSIQIMMGNIIEPRLMGHSLNISPLILLLALSLFGTLWGVVGMFLSVPLTVILLVLLAQFPATRIMAVMISGNGNIESLYKTD